MTNIEIGRELEAAYRADDARTADIASKAKALRAAREWTDRVGMDSYAYRTRRGWRWTPDRTIARMASAIVVTVTEARS